MPLLTVCLPTYNGAPFLAEAIQSILAQTWTDFDLLIVDDHSTDDTPAVIRSFHDRRITFHQNPTRLGLVGNWNRCLELAQGEYICLFHQDDVMLPDNLRQKITILQNYSNVGMVFSDAVLIDSQSQPIAEHWFYSPPFTGTTTIEGQQLLQELITGNNFIPCSSVVAWRECFFRSGRFDARFPFTADLAMWLHIALFYDVAYVDKPLIKYRWHSSNETRNFSDIDQWRQIYLARQTVLTEHPDKIPNAAPLLSQLNQQYQTDSIIRALYHLRHRHYEASQAYLNFAGEINTSGFLLLKATGQALKHLISTKVHKNLKRFVL
ncbi:MAG: glycosyltransferase [Chloroflexi bacterium]|nr:MAG: glycosyltransferase [Chloroflexota bacterium]